MHWIVLGIAAIAFGAGFFGPTTAMIGAGMTVGFICLVVGFFMLISARVAERARPDAMLLTDADVNALRKSMRDARQAREAAQSASKADQES